MAQGKTTIRETVKGGYVEREERTGRFVKVGTDKGVSRSSPMTETVVKDIAARRSAALKRLADR